MGADTGAADLAPIQKKIMAQGFSPALEDLAAVLAAEPDNTEALYMAAVCHRYLGQFEQAAATLGQLKHLAPDFGRAHQEEGHLCRAQGRDQEALLAYSRACQANPALEASYRAQLELLRRHGAHEQLQAVQAQLDHLLRLPKPVVAATDLIAQGKLVRAEEVCRAFLLKVPHHVEAMRLLADVGSRLGALEEAEFLLESAVAFAPDNVQARIDYIRTLRKRQKFAAAFAEAQRLLAMAPDNPQFQSLYAIECMQTGDYSTALATFEQILRKLPDDAITLNSRGHALKTCGQFDEAVASYHAALASKPQHAEAWHSLANLKTYRFSAADRVAMANLAADNNLSFMDRVYVAFALGKACEDAGEYRASFEHYARGNQLKKNQSRYDADKMSAELAAQQTLCSADFFTRRQGCGYPAPDPIFIVGLPRAGSTLLEQILSSHSQIDGTLELPNILSYAQQLRRWQDASGTAPGYPEVLAQLSPQALADYGERFITGTRIHRQGAPFFIDKMPNNFRHIGLIKLILPNAKVIDARREPMACCFSSFKQLFAEGQEFSYSLQDLGQYYRDYVALMEHWDQALPGFVLRVQHEDVLADLEGQVARMLEFIGVPFEERCLRYYETERAVRTPSSEQVRQPIYKDATKQWQHYEQWLEPLRQALAPKSQ
jgi:tetratricopeptide (TPR) repeat protein